jgi:hypothetical protein
LPKIGSMNIENMAKWYEFFFTKFVFSLNLSSNLF